MATIIQICRKSGKRLQPQCARISRIRSGKRSLPSLRGVCDICQCTAEVSDPEAFGLAILDMPGQSSVITKSE